MIDCAKTETVTFNWKFFFVCFLRKTQPYFSRLFWEKTPGENTFEEEEVEEEKKGATTVRVGVGGAKQIDGSFLAGGSMSLHFLLLHPTFELAANFLFLLLSRLFLTVLIGPTSNFKVNRTLKCHQIKERSEWISCDFCAAGLRRVQVQPLSFKYHRRLSCTNSCDEFSREKGQSQMSSRKPREASGHSGCWLESTPSVPAFTWEKPWSLEDPLAPPPASQQDSLESTALAPPLHSQ